MQDRYTGDIGDFGKYYECIVVLNNVRVKVVVKQIDGGQKFFWSITPFWGIHKETKKRKLYGGNPKED